MYQTWKDNKSSSQTSLIISNQTDSFLLHSLTPFRTMSQPLPVSFTGWLPFRVGLGQRDPPSRAGREGPQGPQPHQLPPSSTHRQARQANILWSNKPLTAGGPSDTCTCDADDVVTLKWPCRRCGFQVVGPHCCVFYGALCLLWGLRCDDTSVGSCFAASGTELVIMLI